MSAAKRFYAAVSVGEVQAGSTILLDARALNTPAGAAFVAPTRALAEACAAEWEAQGERIIPASMPLTQLSFAALDETPHRRDAIAKQIAKYVETDLVCHRAETPAGLVARQAAAWDPIVAWAEARFHTRFDVVTGVMPAAVSPQTLTTFEWEVDDLDDFRRTALAQAVHLAGSALIGFALLEAHMDADAAFAAATIDEAWSFERWGEDAEAQARLDRLKADIEAIVRFIACLS
jgi:chaperone required for assembly of F1-ATPase